MAALLAAATFFGDGLAHDGLGFLGSWQSGSPGDNGQGCPDCPFVSSAFRIEGSHFEKMGSDC